MLYYSHDIDIGEEKKIISRVLLIHKSRYSVGHWQLKLTIDFSETKQHTYFLIGSSDFIPFIKCDIMPRHYGTLQFSFLFNFLICFLFFSFFVIPNDFRCKKKTVKTIKKREMNKHTQYWRSACHLNHFDLYLLQLTWTKI